MCDDDFSKRFRFLHLFVVVVHSYKGHRTREAEINLECVSSGGKKGAHPSQRVIACQRVSAREMKTIRCEEHEREFAIDLAERFSGYSTFSL